MRRAHTPLAAPTPTPLAAPPGPGQDFGSNSAIAAGVDAAPASETPLLAALDWDGVLSRGDSGPEVTGLQQALGEHDHPVAVDGKFGSETRGGVRGFQEDADIGVDGLAGPRTLAALKGEAPPADPAPAEVIEAADEGTVIDLGTTVISLEPEQGEAELAAELNLSQTPVVVPAEAPEAPQVQGRETPAVVHEGELTIALGSETGALSAPIDITGPLSDEEVSTALEKLRKYAWNPQWILGLQNGLEVPAGACTGAFNRATVQAIATYQGDTLGQSRPDGYFRPRGTTYKSLSASFPEWLDGVPSKVDTSEHDSAKRDKRVRKSRAAGGGTTPEAAVRALGLAESWEDYVGGFEKMTFCGQTISGHPLFLARLEAAKRQLQLRFPGKSDKEIGDIMGIGRITHVRAPKPDSAGGNHTFGFALDVDPADNPWVLGQDGRDTGNAKTREVIARATAFMGSGTALTLGKMRDSDEGRDTHEMFRVLEESNQALRAYRELAGDRAGIEARLAVASPEIAALGVEHWMTRIQDDDNQLDKGFLEDEGRSRKETNWDADTDNKGFMQLKEEMVVALRDAAGLAWGGCDLGNDSGDMMHFDGRHIPLAKKLRRTAKKLHKEQS